MKDLIWKIVFFRNLAMIKLNRHILMMQRIKGNHLDSGGYLPNTYSSFSSRLLMLLGSKFPIYQVLEKHNFVQFHPFIITLMRKKNQFWDVATFRGGFACSLHIHMGFLSVLFSPHIPKMRMRGKLACLSGPGWVRGSVWPCHGRIASCLSPSAAGVGLGHLWPCTGISGLENSYLICSY